MRIFKTCWWSHIWQYRNPHARTCYRCGKQENEYSDTVMTLAGIVRSISYWEEVL